MDSVMDLVMDSVMDLAEWVMGFGLGFAPAVLGRLREASGL